MFIQASDIRMILSLVRNRVDTIFAHCYFNPAIKIMLCTYPFSYADGSLSACHVFLVPPRIKKHSAPPMDFDSRYLLICPRALFSFDECCTLDGHLDAVLI